MAVVASAQVTLTVMDGVKGIYRYYALQPSTLAKPEKPTTYPPRGEGGVRTFEWRSDGEYETIVLDPSTGGGYIKISDTAPKMTDFIGGKLITTEITPEGEQSGESLIEEVFLTETGPGLYMIAFMIFCVTQTFTEGDLTLEPGIYLPSELTGTVPEGTTAKITLQTGEPESDIIRWGGNPEGLHQVEVGPATYVWKVSDVTFDPALLVGQTIGVKDMTNAFVQEKITIPEGGVQNPSPGVYLVSTLLMLSVEGSQFPTGIYFGSAGGMKYVASLTLPEGTLPSEAGESIWSDVEPGYDANMTNSLYTTDCTVFHDGAFEWSEVQLSSSYEAAKSAYNKAAAAARTATNYIDQTDSGLVVGNMTASVLGRNVLIDADSVDIRNGDTVLASYGDSVVELGKNSPESVIKMCNGIGIVKIDEDPFGDDSIAAMQIFTDGDAMVQIGSKKNVRLLSNGDAGLADHGTVQVRPQRVTLAIGNGTDIGMGSGGYLDIIPTQAILSCKNIGMYSPNAIKSISSPFEVNSYTLTVSAAKAVTSSWGYVQCGTVKASSGSAAAGMFEPNGTGFTCKRAGRIALMANVYITGASAGDSVQALVGGGTGVYAATANSCAPAGGTMQLTIAPAVMNVAAGQTLSLLVANWTASRGTIPTNDATTFTAWYLE